MNTAAESPRFTVIAPMRNEAGAVEALADEIAAACSPHGPFEAIFVDDGSDDETPVRIAAAQARHPWLRTVRHPGSFGQSAAVLTGVRAARAPVVVTIDGDGQNPPAELPRLVAPLLDPACAPDLGLVCGVRTRRRDDLGKRISSRMANGLRRLLLRDGSPDTGCGLKAFRRDAFLMMPYFDHMHRYLPSLFLAEGWRVAHAPVDHRERETGRTKYGNLDRALVGALDLLGVWWLLRRRRRSAPARRAALSGELG
ncbi:MAG: glycosyltransferase family 2 protein [Rubrimonas sp.]